jgi:branched-subunit amino acid aminotransferase/4-amino-4-deoxychorismate lyase
MATVTNLLIRNRKVVPCSFSSAGEFIRAIPPTGVYSTCRTIGQTNIVDLKSHYERLSKVPVKDSKTFEQTILCCLSMVVHHFKRIYREQNDESSETRITISVTETMDHDFDFQAYGEVLPPVPKAPIKVDIRTGERENPEVKSTQWIQDRQKFNQMKPQDVEEVVLMDEHGELSEGLTSNFGVLVKGTVQTAPEGKVLHGTMLQHVLDVLDKKKVQVVRQCPNIKDINDWEAAWISSTSRMLLPINHLSVPEKNIERDFEPQNGLFKEVNEDILLTLRANATSIPVMDGHE